MAVLDPFRRLMAAVILRAVRDIDHPMPDISAAAWAYIDSDGFDSDCAWLQIDPAAARALLHRGNG